MKTPQQPEFDQFASNYDAALNRGLALSGEGKEYFIAGRIAWLRRCLERHGGVPKDCRVLDFGCGTGAAFPHLRSALDAEFTGGVDISTAELELARRDYPWADTFTPDAVPSGFEMDVIYSNGTFHHIPPAERPAAVEMIRRCLKPGGIFALWENNPWNPGTRWVMSRVAFDRHAITLSAPEARRLLKATGFEVLRTDFLFIFPRFLSPLRGIERFVTRLPAGAQYQVLCRKPR